MNRLSVIVITHNEAHDIERCLSSVHWADEIIVVDSGSEDNTRELSRQYTDLVYLHQDWQGYGVQKNRALSYATQDWVLSLDADEVVSPVLASEIQCIVLGASLYSAYWIPRRSTYCGRLIRHGDWGTDGSLRLFKRGRAQFDGAQVHESLVVEGAIGKLRSPLYHDTYKNLEEMLAKLNAFTTASASMHYQKGKNSSLFKALSRSMWTFFRSYCLRLGFLDGREGLMLAISNAEHTYYRYLKLLYRHVESMPLTIEQQDDR